MVTCNNVTAGSHGLVAWRGWRWGALVAKVFHRPEHHATDDAHAQAPQLLVISDDKIADATDD